jgi:ATP-dependent DNA helicase RecG
LEDIDEKRLRKFIEESGKEYESLEKSLDKLKLIRQNKLLNSGVILFGKEPQKFFLNAKLRCAVFGTEDTTVDIDMQEFEGNLFDLIEEAEKYFLKNIHIGMKIEGLKRIDIPEINKEAFREAIINAFCHRDYFNQDAVHLAIFKDRIEIRSPGLLFGDLTIKRIRTEKVSERRNELLAQMFHLIHFVENWGKGIDKILKLEPKTEFKELGRKFYTIFPRNAPENVGERDGDRVGEKVGEKVGENQVKIMSLMRENPSITIKELSEIIKMAEKNIEVNIAKLKEKRLIKRIGPAKGGHWEVLK